MPLFNFKYRTPTKDVRSGTVEANNKTGAYLAVMADTRLKGCVILKTTFKINR